MAKTTNICYTWTLVNNCHGVLGITFLLILSKPVKGGSKGRKAHRIVGILQRQGQFGQHSLIHSGQPLYGMLKHYY